MVRGWYGNRQQHSLASKGVKTNIKLKTYGELWELYKEYDTSKDPLTRDGKKVLYTYTEETDDLIYRNPVNINGHKISIWYIHDWKTVEDEDGEFIIPIYRKPSNEELNDIVYFLKEMNNFYPELLEYMEENGIELRLAKDKQFNKMRNEKNRTLTTGKNMGYADASMKDDRWIMLRGLNSNVRYDNTFRVGTTQIFVDVFWHELYHVMEMIEDFNSGIKREHKYGWNEKSEPINDVERRAINFENKMMNIINMGDVE